MRRLLYISLALVMVSCFKEDTPVQRFDRGGISEIQIEMGENYGEQLFYDLNTNSIVSQNPRTAWDIAFSSVENEKIIKLNSGRFMFAAESNSSKFEEVTDTAGLKFAWDYPNNKADSQALYQWELSDKVYVLDMGFDLDQSSLGFVKIKFSLVSENEIAFSYMNLDGTNPGSGTLTKNADYNYVYYSFLDHKQVDIEPKKEEYDLYFGQYIFYFEVEDKAYYVNGVLLNPHKVEGLTRFKQSYEEISIDDFTENELSTQADIIGYNWKYFDFQASRYEIVPDRNFIIKDVEGFYYKLRFTSFYNKDGIKGYPQMENKKL